MFGDIPNSSTKNRFLGTEFGKEFLKNWELKMSTPPPLINNPHIALAEDKQCASFDDNHFLNIVKHIREQGFHAYILAQSPQLPFGHTREDILVIYTE